MNEKGRTRWWWLALFPVTLLVLVTIAVKCSQQAMQSDRPISAGWHQKAVASARAAERSVGGFNASDRVLYKNGLRHILSAHGKVGAYTIGQVIEDERQRSLVRANAIQARRQIKIVSEEKRLDGKATDQLMGVMRQMNDALGYKLFDGGRIAGTDCAVRIDADHYEYASSQDKALIEKMVFTMCRGSYMALGGTDQRAFPDDGLKVTAINLAGDRVFGDTLVPKSR